MFQSCCYVSGSVIVENGTRPYAYSHHPPPTPSARHDSFHPTRHFFHPDVKIPRPNDPARQKLKLLRSASFRVTFSAVYLKVKRCCIQPLHKNTLCRMSSIVCALYVSTGVESSSGVILLIFLLEQTY